MKIIVYQYKHIDDHENICWVYSLISELAGKDKPSQAGIFTLNEDIRTAELVKTINGETFLLLNKNDRFITADELTNEGEQMGLGVYTPIIEEG